MYRIQVFQWNKYIWYELGNKILNVAFFVALYAEQGIWIPGISIHSYEKKEIGIICTKSYFSQVCVCNVK